MRKVITLSRNSKRSVLRIEEGTRVLAEKRLTKIEALRIAKALLNHFVG